MGELIFSIQLNKSNLMILVLNIPDKFWGIWTLGKQTENITGTHKALLHFVCPFKQNTCTGKKNKAVKKIYFSIDSCIGDEWNSLSFTMFFFSPTTKHSNIAYT